MDLFLLHTIASECLSSVFFYPNKLSQFNVEYEK